MAQPSYYKYVTSPIGLVEICTSDDALCALEFVDYPRHHSANNPLADEAAAQIEAYFYAQRDHFDLPLKLNGTAFQMAVWQQLIQIPYGCAVSYQDIAKRIAHPKAVRAVGAANSRNPIAIIVPCHRVIGANGQLTGYASGLWRKAWLLDHEGCKNIRTDHPGQREIPRK